MADGHGVGIDWEREALRLRDEVLEGSRWIPAAVMGGPGPARARMACQAQGHPTPRSTPLPTPPPPPPPS